MATRVLLALPDEPGPYAEALGGAGHVLEVCPPGRLPAVSAAFGPAAVVLRLDGAEPGPVLLELVGSPQAPALVALLAARAAERGAGLLGHGPMVLLPHDAPPSAVVAAVHAAVARRALQAELAIHREGQRQADAVLLLGPSSLARRLRDGLERVASTPRTTVLVTAPALADAGALARGLHARSARGEGPLVELTSGRRPDADEAEALSERGEAVDRAEGGTLLLHQVGRLGPAGQLALARALEDRRGGSGPDVRVVATSSLELEEQVQAGRFREELLYRLNVLTLRVPPLAERAEDLGEMVRALIEQVVGPGRPPPTLAPEALEDLRGRDWPGGLLQLRLTLELALARAVAPVLELEHLMPPGAAAAAGSASEWLASPGTVLTVPDRTLRSAEAALIRQVLAETGGNKLRSAEILGIHRTTLYSKLRDYGIDG